MDVATNGICLHSVIVIIIAATFGGLPVCQAWYHSVKMFHWIFAGAPCDGHHGFSFYCWRNGGFRCWALLMVATSKRQRRMRAGVWLGTTFRGSIAADACRLLLWVRRCAKAWTDMGNRCRCYLPKSLALLGRLWHPVDSLRSDWKGFNKGWTGFMKLKEMTAWNWLGKLFLKPQNISLCSIVKHL